MKFKYILIISSLIILILFGGCSHLKDDLIFCENKLSEFSNATEIKRIYNENSYIGCSDGDRIAWYTKGDFQLTLYGAEK